ncbi:hypothetical protein pipiens_001318 [Culex pipiens pipiens]|uniref:Cuticle protein 6 n=1 Tax=Culex pipiens pipiens TaxID=38569 RepID=A0ABD1D3H2_CULPP
MIYNKTGVKLMTICPGATETAIYNTAGTSILTFPWMFSYGDQLCETFKTQKPEAVGKAVAKIITNAELSSQYHAQDSLGQYSYGYNGGLSAKAETKSFDGVTRGSYSYLDAENKLQTVSYTADALNGFRAQASNLPQAPVEARVAPAPVQDTPEVAKARADHLVAVEEAKVRNANAASSDESAIVVSAAPAAVAPIAPIVPQIATYAAPIALAPASGFAYSHSTVNLKPEVYAAAPAPVATIAAAPASFAYQTYSAAAPALYNTWSQAPAYAYSYGAPAFYAANTAAVPLPVQDTPEVMQAKAEHFAAVAEAKARNLQ